MLRFTVLLFGDLDREDDELNVEALEDELEPLPNDCDDGVEPLDDVDDAFVDRVDCVDSVGAFPLLIVPTVDSSVVDDDSVGDDSDGDVLTDSCFSVSDSVLPNNTLVLSLFSLLSDEPVDDDPDEDDGDVTDDDDDFAPPFCFLDFLPHPLSTNFSYLTGWDDVDKSLFKKPPI